MPRIKNFLCFVLIALVLFPMVSFAADCSDLELVVTDVDVKEGSTASFAFYLHNNTNERFYIDRVSAYDFAEGIITQALRWDRVALSGSEASIVISIEALEGASAKDRNAYVQVRGHFLSGKVCHYRDIKAVFPVRVIKEDASEAAPDCGHFDIVLPSSINIHNFGTLDFIVENYTSEDARIYVKGVGASVDTIMYLIPAKSRVYKTLRIESEQTSALILFDADLGACGTKSYELTVHNVVFEKPEEKPDVEMSYSIAKDENGYLVSVILKNLSQFEINGILYAEVPENWYADSFEVMLAPFEEATIDMRVIPEEKSETQSFDIVFQYNGSEERLSVQLQKEKREEPFAIGLTTLVASAILAGILVMVIIILIGSTTSKRIKEPWQEVV